MPSDKPQRKARIFLNERLQTQQPFTKAEFKAATGWQDSTFRTYWSKQFKPLLVKVPNGSFRVSEAYRPFTPWKRFQRHVTQKRKVAADYKKKVFNSDIIYEFFMPLTNETALRSTLDALFFKDNVIPKLQAIGATELAEVMQRSEDESDAVFFDRICAWIGDPFGGYSIYHVDGRFLAGKMKTRDEAAVQEKNGQRYLVDETTAVTRFIFPCEDPAEAFKVRYFFDKLFVETIIQLVNAEDQIWMVETGLENKVHIWRVEDKEDDGSIEVDSYDLDDEDSEDEEPNLLSS